MLKMEGGVHPKLFIIPWCETYNLSIHLARRLWVEGFQDGDTVSTITINDLADFHLSGEEAKRLMRAVSSYKKNKENVDKCIRLWGSSSDGKDVRFKKDKRLCKCFYLYVVLCEKHADKLGLDSD